MNLDHWFAAGVGSREQQTVVKYGFIALEKLFCAGAQFKFTDAALPSVNEEGFVVRDHE